MVYAIIKTPWTILTKKNAIVKLFGHKDTKALRKDNFSFAGATGLCVLVSLRPQNYLLGG
jgi:hypothetical protein